MNQSETTQEERERERDQRAGHATEQASITTSAIVWIDSVRCGRLQNQKSNLSFCSKLQWCSTSLKLEQINLARRKSHKPVVLDFFVSCTPGNFLISINETSSLSCGINYEFTGDDRLKPICRGRLQKSH